MPRLPYRRPRPAPVVTLHPGIRAELRDVSLLIDGKALLRDLSFSLPGNGITAILGPNGAGKSLLLKLLHGLIAPSAGDVLWAGSPIDAALRAHQAMVFQKPVLLRRSVAANVDFVLKARGRRDPERRRALLDDVGLTRLARQPARTLSGGEQQRLALARALAIDPDVLFLDEATANLDPASVQMIETLVQRVAENGTKVIFVSHDLHQARRMAQDVVFLHAGALAEHSSADAFFAGPISAAGQAYLEGRIVL